MYSTHQDLLVKQTKSIFQNVGILFALSTLPFVYTYTCSLYSTTCFDAHVETYVNARKHTQLKYPTTGAYLELDIWIPEYEISFEFQVFEHLYSLMTTTNNDV